MKITLAFDGGNRPGNGGGFGSYAIVKGNMRTITRLEFNSGMSNHEAEYDTLIMALRALVRQERSSDVSLEIQTPSQLVANQVQGTWETRDVRMQMRRDQVANLLRQFASYTIVQTSPDYTARLLR